MKLATSLFVAMLLGMTTSVAHAANWYQNLADCQEAYRGGNIIEYVPAPNVDRAERVRAQAGVTVSKTQAPSCVTMQVSDGSFKAVFVPQGTEVFTKDGELVAHIACGNEIRGSIALTKLEIYRGEQGPPGESIVGPRGKRGPPGRSYVGPKVLQYNEGTENRRSDQLVAHVVSEVADTVQVGLITKGAVKLGRAYIDGGVRREGIRANRDIRVAQIDAYGRINAAPSTLIIDNSVTDNSVTTQIIGDCNAVLGSRVNCETKPVKPQPTNPTNPTNPTQPNPITVRPEPGVDPPIIRPIEPGVDQPIFRDNGNVGVSTPVIGINPEPGVGPAVGNEPSVGRPIFGDGGSVAPVTNPLPPTTGEPGN